MRKNAMCVLHERLFLQTGELKEAYRGWIEETLERGGLERRPEWTESIAMGGEAFVRRIKERLGIRNKTNKTSRAGVGVRPPLTRMTLAPEIGTNSAET